MATVSTLSCNIIPVGPSASSVLAASSNVMPTTSLNSALGLRPLSLRSVPRRGSEAVQRQQRRVCYRGPSALFVLKAGKDLIQSLLIPPRTLACHLGCLWAVNWPAVRISGVFLFPWIIDRGTEGSDGKKPEKKFITKEEEPQQYWQAADEREGKNPMGSPLPYILILSVLSPFLIMAVAFANGWIKIPVR